jgi:ABC-2 type transport system permease protein
MDTELMCIYVLWLREMKRFYRAKSRVIGTLGMPLFMLLFLGLGFRRISVPDVPSGVSYLSYLVPGIIGMTLLFSSSFAGMSVLWDREFGFLKEIMVAPVSRVSIVLGRIVGGSTTALIQGFVILILSLFMDFTIPGIISLMMTIAVMILICIIFISLGLVFASNMKDMHGYSLITNFVVFPLFLLSGALFPISNLPGWLQVLAYFDPLTYGVDGLRGVLIGVSAFPLAIDAVMLIASSLIMIGLGTFFFERAETK